MPTLRIKKSLRKETYFITFTTIGWIDIFTQPEYFELIIISLKFFQKKLDLNLYGYVIMTNHIHLLLKCSNMITFIKNFKSYTTKEIKQRIREDTRTYLFDLLKNFPDNRKKNKFRVWQSNNWPELVETQDFFNEKLEYIHENPVTKQFVSHEEDWLYSSARNNIQDDHSIIKVDTSHYI